ncbi:MAG: endolytic transglycosylase MltG [Candidatus Paceibacterota bacterium]
MKALAKGFFTIVIAAYIVALAGAAVFEFHLAPRQQKDTIMILRGENALQIANDLKAEGYIKSKVIFIFLVLKEGNLKKLKAGEYDFKGLDYRAIIDKLLKGQVIVKTATVIPGWTIRDIAASPQIKEIIPNENFSGAASDELRGKFDFLDSLPADDDLEGYLFPDTYQFPKDTDADGLAVLMLENFDKKLIPAFRDKIKVRGISIHEAVIMASILEKEVITLEDKKIVAGILYKRLEVKMPLQVDCTLLYSKTGELKAFDREIDSLYNTYRYAGLPPGPICNPGIESIEAAIEPLDSPYWFYLSAPEGTTYFSKTYDEHLANKAKYLDK